MPKQIFTSTRRPQSPCQIRPNVAFERDRPDRHCAGEPSKRSWRLRHSSGLFEGKEGRIGGRLSQSLIDRAEALTGVTTDTELIEFALGNIALDDGFAEHFRQVRGKVDDDIDLDF